MVQDLDIDVQKQKEFVLSENFPNAEFPLRILKLKKIYNKYGCGIKSAKDLVAVDNLCLSAQEGKVFCLLGHNGAGKSTVINCLTGVVPVTSGDAVIFGNSISDDLDKIRDITGVCPQHDILWNELTAREHLKIFAEMKGIPNQDIKNMIDEKLKEVFLTDVGNQQAGTFSGGMKRRLSVAMSTIGNPKIIFMDEPTTGMDPGNRRHVWNMIEKVKKGRVIILTTHSMEEADVLGDQIAIMVSGKLKCIGSALHLKSKFGTGYKIRIVTPIEKRIETKQFVAGLLPSAKLEDEAAGSLTYTLPNEAQKLIPAFFAEIEHHEGTLINDWGISQTTLEDVFLHLTRNAPLRH